MGLNETEMANALGIVYSSVAGNHQVTLDASLMKRIQPGFAAQAAVLAVQLSRRGIRGPVGVFEGADGFFRVYLHGAVDPSVVRSDLGRRFELLDLSYKPYPCCRDLHTSIDAALEARARARRPASDVKEIRVGLTTQGFQIGCTPAHVRLRPRTIVEAQFSIPYATAAAYVDGIPGIGHFSDEGITRPDILDLAQRVKPFIASELDSNWGRFVTPARMAVEFNDGHTVETSVDYPKGHPKNPMTESEATAKTRDCATFAARPLPPDVPDRLISTIAALERLPNISELMAVMT